MAVRGRSITAGRPPAWLDAVSDIRFTGISGLDVDTVFHFETLRLRDAAPQLYDQAEFWATKPDSECTAIDLLGDVIQDVDAGLRESDRFDSHLLRRVSRFSGAVNAGFDRIMVPAERSGALAPITQHTIDQAESLRVETPPSRQVRVAGRLDMLRVSNQTLALNLDDGEEIRGVLASEEVLSLKSLLGKRVLLLGRAVYRPSGRLLRIDVEGVESGEGVSSFLSTIPKPSSLSRREVTTARPQTSKSGVAAFFGTWPGDETDEELLAGLRSLG